MKPIDWSKPVQTRAGHPLRVLCTDRFGELPVVALMENGDIEVFDIDGSYINGKKEHRLDAINTPIKKHGWVNVYFDPAPFSHRSLWAGNTVYESEAAANNHNVMRVGCCKIEWTES